MSGLLARVIEKLSQLSDCKKGYRKCDLKRCIPYKWFCDGHVDCKDHTDELNCDNCRSGMIHCGNFKCISPEQMCDGRVDCPNAQDERNCCKFPSGKMSPTTSCCCCILFLALFLLVRAKWIANNSSDLRTVVLIPFRSIF